MSNSASPFLVENEAPVPHPFSLDDVYDGKTLCQYLTNDPRVHILTCGHHVLVTEQVYDGCCGQNCIDADLTLTKGRLRCVQCRATECVLRHDLRRYPRTAPTWVYGLPDSDEPKVVERRKEYEQLERVRRSKRLAEMRTKAIWAGADRTRALKKGIELAKASSSKSAGKRVAEHVVASSSKMKVSGSHVMQMPVRAKKVAVLALRPARRVAREGKSATK